MKAVKYDPAKDEIDGWLIEEKFDGVRVQIVVNGIDDIRIYSRNKTKSTGTFNDYTDKLPHVVDCMHNILSNMPPHMSHQIYDGEALASQQGSRENNFKYVTGTLNSLDAYERQLQNELIHIVIFNIPTIDSEYEEIVAILNTYFTRIDSKIINSATVMRNDNGFAMTFFDDIIQMGGEGIILYNPKGKYKHSTTTCAASRDVLKIKDRYEREVLVTDMIEGTGKDAGSCGALICTDHNGKIFKVGSGLNEGDATDSSSRDWMWMHRNDVPFVIEIYYHSETTDSYRLPVFKRNRFYDKAATDLNGCE